MIQIQKVSKCLECGEKILFEKGKFTDNGDTICCGKHHGGFVNSQRLKVVK